ncbi:hypothetical protein LKD70_14520, partial [Ruminococcus sp. CLA-AA-H200]
YKENRYPLTGITVFNAQNCGIHQSGITVLCFRNDGSESSRILIMTFPVKSILQEEYACYLEGKAFKFTNQIAYAFTPYLEKEMDDYDMRSSIFLDKFD